MFVPPHDQAGVLTKYQQWQTENKKAEKVRINATIGDIFEELKNQLKSFLIHRYVKRIQTDHMENLINHCDGKSVLIQVDFSENASLIIQNEIQSAHWNHSQATIFTAHAWIRESCKESFAIISDDLNHIKNAVYIFMSFLYNHLKNKYPNI